MTTTPSGPTATNPVPSDRHGSAVVTLPSDLEISITRVFDAPAALVFEVWTTPKHVRRFWARDDAPLTVCDIDLRVGGSWRYVTRSTDGTELGWHGTYKAIDAPVRLVSTEVFEGYPDGEALNTLVLDEHDGQTTMTVLVLHSSKENRDGHVNSGMESGLQLTLDCVEDILAELSAEVAALSAEAAGPTVADRYRNVAGRFTARVAEVPADAWDNPAPCEGWVARDVVRHLVEWVPPFLASGSDVTIPNGPSVEADPLGAWTTLSNAIQAVLDDPGVGERTFSHPQAGTHALDAAIGMFILGDVLVHTWDLARSTGLDETLDEDEVHSMYAGMLPLDAMLRGSGHYGARVEAPDDAHEQTKLIAFTGRQP